MTVSQSPTRKHIIDVAAKLFYAEGIGRVSVDAVAEKAGVTKRTLYYHFASKDELIAAYLLAQDQPSLKQLSAWYEACEGEVGDKIEAVFKRLAAVARHPKWRDCGFMRTVAELAATPGHPAIKEARSRSGILRINHLASLAKPALLKQETTICLCSTGIFD